MYLRFHSSVPYAFKGCTGLIPYTGLFAEKSAGGCPLAKRLTVYLDLAQIRKLLDMLKNNC